MSSGNRQVVVDDPDGHGAQVVSSAPGANGRGMVVHVASQPAGVVGLTDAQLRATPVPVSGTVSVNSLPTIAFSAPQHVIVDSGAVTVSGTVTTGGLTDAQLRASAVPVSMATQTPDVTDRAARLLGHVVVDTLPTISFSAPQHVIVDTAPTTSVTQGTSPWVTNDPGLADTLGQKAMAGSAAVVLASDQASIPVAATLAAETTKVIGTVNVATLPTVSFSAPQHVIVDSATLGTVTVSGPLTDTQLRASAVPISVATLPSISFSAPQHVIVDSATLGTVTVTNPNLDTPLSGVAKESGGNLATIAGKDFATQTTLALIKAKTDNLDTALSTRTKPTDTQLVDGSTVTQPISAASLPLPAGAALDSSLTTTNAHLSAMRSALNDLAFAAILQSEVLA